MSLEDEDILEDNTVEGLPDDAAFEIVENADKMKFLGELAELSEEYEIYDIEYTRERIEMTNRSYTKYSALVTYGEVE